MPVRAHGLALKWLRLRAIGRRHAYVLVRSPHRLFDVTLWPLVDVILFGSLAAYARHRHRHQRGEGGRATCSRASCSGT